MAALFTPEQEARLKQKKVELKIANERYLRQHPELNDLLSEVVGQTLLHRPDDPVAFTERMMIESDLAQMVAEARARREAMQTKQIDDDRGIETPQTNLSASVQSFSNI
eukprot:TRINITY_DN22093_c0_g1_i1.p3 TRINITY_DN22093_c0_g1~~TRINITY_DN22093_c0_g1_i1.p3  ORF type:complete len:109 (+),score=55.83 TRINITY_DN22093_c0_g1_i1:95-421(+)